MNILLVGSGGREHALAWKICQSKDVEKIYVFPGNDGMQHLEKIQIVAGKVTPETILDVAQKFQIDFVVIGPEQPLADGAVDLLTLNKILVLGPSKAASRLESSKFFAKEWMLKWRIPTASFYCFEQAKDALAQLDLWEEGKGIVVKADELAAGKGVVVTDDKQIAKQTVLDFMENPACPVKSKRILLEEKLAGKEVSAFALCDGTHFISLGYVCDYKRVFNNDQGPNTGGMGGYSPQNWPSPACKQYIQDAIFRPVLEGMQQQGIPFKGFLYAGLMIHQEQVFVLEFNVRLGDPEAQILLPLIEEDIVPYLKASAEGQLDTLPPLKIPQNFAVHVVMTSEGYPSTDETPLRLNESITYPSPWVAEKAYLFFAGVKKNSKGFLVNSGGRVLGVTAVNSSLEGARTTAYDWIQQIHFAGAHWRTDIAK